MVLDGSAVAAVLAPYPLTAPDPPVWIPGCG